MLLLMFVMFGACARDAWRDHSRGELVWWAQRFTKEELR